MEVKPGYKQTEVGVIPEEWEVQTGEEITTLIGKGASPRWQGFEYSDRGMLFVTSENVRDGFLDIREPKYLPLAFHEKIKRTKLQKQDILVNLVGASIGRSCQIQQELGEANVNQAVAVFRVKEKYYSAYIACCFQAPTTIKRILELQVDAARPNISLGDLRRFLIPLPPLPEQHAIAEALSDVDALLAALDRLIAKQRDLKQAAMQQLLTGQTRLPGFTGEWKLWSILQTALKIIDYRGRTPLKLGMDWGGGDIPALSARNVKMGYIDFEEETYYGSEALYKRWMLNGDAKKGDILMTTEAPLGNIAVIPDDRKYILSQRTILIQVNPEIAVSSYLMQAMMASTFQKLLSENSSGSTATGIQRKRLETLELNLPPISEQTAIAAVLTDMDAELVALEQRRDKTRLLKQAMMQELLTGRTRLVG